MRDRTSDGCYMALIPATSLGEAGWLKAVRLEDYVPRANRRAAFSCQAPDGRACQG